MLEARGSLDGLRASRGMTGVRCASHWFVDCHALVPYGGARNDEEGRGVGDPLTQGAGAGHPERDDTETTEG
ncbi:MAG: hypothetical protein NC218_11135 [Acetobacter sp.]|nr:hypothetical protein [Acetobacter sp.]